jgi:SUN family beta-glucosidase
MKAAFILAALTSAVVATQAEQLVKRETIYVDETVTVTVCALGSSILSEADCEAGINNGTLRWADDGQSRVQVNLVRSLLLKRNQTNMKQPLIAAEAPAPAPSPKEEVVAAPVPVRAPEPARAPAPALVPAPAPAPVPKPAVVAAPAPLPEAAAPVVQQIKVAAPPPPPPAAPAVNRATSNSLFSASSNPHVNRAFVDGAVPCTDVPLEFGAMPVHWVNPSGWASVQIPENVAYDGAGNVVGIGGLRAEPNGECVEGSYCSYNCPMGAVKTQWPEYHLQPANGASLGGLLCKNGFLHRSNQRYESLCTRGTDKMRAVIQNRMSRNVAICRTNYPG